MRLSLRLPLTLSLVIVVGAAVGGGIAVGSTGDALRDRALEGNEHSAIAYAAALQSYLEGAASQVTLSASSGSGALKALLADRRPDAISLGGGAPVRGLAQRLLGSTRAFTRVLLLSAEGRLVLVHPLVQQAASSRTDLSFLPWVQTALRTRATTLSDLHVSPSTQQPSVVVATPVRDPAGRVVGVWAAALDLGRFSQVGIARADTERATSYGVVTDSRGLVVAHQADARFVEYQSDFRSVPAVAAALAGRSGRGEWFNPVDRERKLGAYRPLGETGWAVVFATRKDVALAPARSLAHTIELAAAVVALALFVVSFLLLRRGLRPLHQLVLAAQAMARNRPPEPIRLSRHDEITELAEAFSAMRERVVERDAELRRRARAVEQANLELESFNYSVSHDLRSPLRAIEGFSSILVEDHAASLDPEAVHLLGRIRAATIRMGSLIDDLLSLSRVGRAELHRERVDVSALCREAVRELTAAEPDRDVEVSIDPGIVLDGDPQLLRCVVDNLLGNAWKFTAKTEQPRIEVTTSPVGNDLFVRDNGVGFAMEDAGRLFGAFQRLHTTRDFPGSGIGLATVQRIAHRHGGQVLAWSEPDHGASFLFTTTDQQPPEAADRPWRAA